MQNREMGSDKSASPQGQPVEHGNAPGSPPNPTTEVNIPAADGGGTGPGATGSPKIIRQTSSDIAGAGVSRAAALPMSGRERNKKIFDFVAEYTNIIALVLLFIAASILQSSFLNQNNLSNVLLQVMVDGIIAVGMTYVILLGGIDLSVGSLLALSSSFIVVAITPPATEGGKGGWGWPLPLALLVIFALSFVIGLWNGWPWVRFKIHPFVSTLAMLLIAKGVALIITGAQSYTNFDPFITDVGSKYIDPLVSTILVGLGAVAWLYFFVRTVQRTIKETGKFQLSAAQWISTVMTLAGITLALYIFTSTGIQYSIAIFAVVAVVGGIILQYTRYGRHLYAIGGNEEAARLSGINVSRDKIIAMVATSFLAVLAGFVLVGRVNAGTPLLGNGEELNVIAAVVIGGTSLLGGVGTIYGTIIGVLILGILNNLLSLAGLQSEWKNIVIGLVIMAAVLVDARRRRQ